MTMMHDHDKPTPKDVLEHHGIKGMRWGVRTAGKAIGTSFNSVSTRDSGIVKARQTLPTARREFKGAKLQYKVDKAKFRENKKTIGRAKAKQILHQDGKIKLHEARSKFNEHKTKAMQDTSNEAINRFVHNLLATQR